MTEGGQGRFTRGASSMVAAVFIAKLLGILVIVPMQNLMGEVPLGIYGLVYPLYTLMLTISTAGFPIALSKRISDLTARGKTREASLTFAIVGRTLLLFGFVSFLALWFGGPWIITLMDPDKSLQRDAVPSIYALAPALLIFPLMSAQRGYLQGNLKLEPSAASQVLEQFVRVATIIIGLLIAVHYGVGAAGTSAIATFGATTGAIAGAILLIVSVRRLRKEMARKSRHAPKLRLKAGQVMGQLFVYALPISLGAIVFPLSQNIDSLTVPRELLFNGMGSIAAIKQFAIYTREAMPLVAVPLSFATAIGASIMPAITEAVATSNRRLAKERMQTSLRMTAFITLPAAVALGFLASPIDVALFKSPTGATLIALTALMSIFSALELVSTYILQGYDRFYQPVIHMGVGMVIKLIFNLLLIPLLGINGAAVASTLGYLTSSWLNMSALRRASDVQVTFPSIAWRSGVAALVVGIWLYGVQYLYTMFSISLHAENSRLLAIAAVLIGMVIATPLYLIVSLWVKAVDQSELERLPVLGRYLGRIIAR